MVMALDQASSLRRQRGLPSTEAVTSNDDGCAPITMTELRAMAQTMSLANSGAGDGARLLNALLDERVDCAGLILRIYAQPTIALRVIRVANSAYYGRSGSIATVPEAAVLLGLTTLRGIAAAACFDSMTSAHGKAAGFDLPAFRAHSLATACAAQMLASALAPAEAGPAFVAGLLHDIGLVAQWRLRPAWYARFHAQAPGDGSAEHLTPDDERRCFGMLHADCARLLLTDWRLPPVLIDAVALHETPAAASAEDEIPPLHCLLHSADHLAAAAGYGLPSDPSGAWLPELQARHGLGADRIDAACAALQRNVERYVGVFGDGST